MPSNHLILCHPLLLLPSIFPSIRVFSNNSALPIRWPQYWSFSFNISPFNEHPGLISFRMDWLDLLAVQGTLKSLLEHHSSKVSILRCSAFFIVQLSHPLWCAKYCIKKEQWWDHDIAVYWRNPTSHLETSEPVSLYKGLQPPDAKSWLIWKDPDAGKDWRWEEKGTTENEVVGWYHRLNGHESEQAPDVDEQWSLECCSPWGRKGSDTTEWLNWTDLTDNFQILKKTD